MTQLEIEYVKKLKEQNALLCSLINWDEQLSADINNCETIENELTELGKQCQFEMLCDPDIFEASANEHFEQGEKKLKELLSISAKMIGEVVDNYEADAINLPAEMYNELKFHLKQLHKNI